MYLSFGLVFTLIVLCFNIKLTALLKLKEIIAQLDEQAYTSFEGQLTKTKADNFLFLTRSYRKGDYSDNDIISSLNLNSNSFYVLKSRLYDKIKKHISVKAENEPDSLMAQIQQIPERCYNYPREIAIAFLEKLEDDLLKHDMHGELLIVYSALKKIHLKSDKYFHFSQLYNKQIAFLISLEKVESILCNFNLILGQYQCSREKQYLDKLLFLKNDIQNHLNLNPSRRIEMVRNIIDAQLYLFCDEEVPEEFDIENCLNSIHNLWNAIPESSIQKKWELPVDFLFFEYYRRVNLVKAKPYYDRVNDQLAHLMLYTDVALVTNFLKTKLVYNASIKSIDDLIMEKDLKILTDPNDVYTKVMYGLYQSVLNYLKGKTKEAISSLNEIINLYSFKDFFHININVKLTLAFYYIEIKEYELAENLIKSIYRKIKSEKLSEYDNVLDFIKVLNSFIEEKPFAKWKDAFELFIGRNNGKYQVLNHLIPLVTKKTVSK